MNYRVEKPPLPLPRQNPIIYWYHPWPQLGKRQTEVVQLKPDGLDFAFGGKRATHLQRIYRRNACYLSKQVHRATVFKIYS